MTLVIQRNPKSYYHRHRQFNRQGSQIKHTILNTLVKRGSTSITKVCYLTQTSHKQAKKFVMELIAEGLIEPITSKQIKHISQLNAHVNKVFILTPLGRKYITKSNRLEAMIKWHG